MTETDPNHKTNPIFINTTDKETKTYEFAKKNPIFVSSVTKLSSHPVPSSQVISFYFQKTILEFFKGV